MVESAGGWLDEAARVVAHGGVVALAFERLFGLAANALDEEAVARAAGIKERDRYQHGGKPIQVIVPSIEDVSMVADWPDERVRALAKRFWPGPLTLLLPARSGLPRPLVGPNGLIGVRVPGRSAALSLVRRCGVPLTATSANRKGARELLHSDGLAQLDEVDLVVPGQVVGPPGSTIVDVSAAPWRVLRQGVLSLGDVDGF